MMSRVILITGAATGIGAATAQYLATEGWKVIVSARKQDAAQKAQWNTSQLEYLPS